MTELDFILLAIGAGVVVGVFWGLIDAHRGC